jgi:hypothetical protein
MTGLPWLCVVILAAAVLAGIGVIWAWGRGFDAGREDALLEVDRRGLDAAVARHPAGKRLALPELAHEQPRIPAAGEMAEGEITAMIAQFRAELDAHCAAAEAANPYQVRP